MYIQLSGGVVFRKFIGGSIVFVLCLLAIPAGLLGGIYLWLMVQPTVLALGVCVLVILLGMVIWYRRSRAVRRAAR